MCCKHAIKRPTHKQKAKGSIFLLSPNEHIKLEHRLLLTFVHCFSAAQQGHDSTMRAVGPKTDGLDIVAILLLLKLTTSKSPDNHMIIRAFMYQERESNPHGTCVPQDFKSCVSTSSTIPARLAKLHSKMLRSYLPWAIYLALLTKKHPDARMLLERKTGFEPATSTLARSRSTS